MRRTWLLILILLLIPILTMAAPPITEITEFDDGLFIEYPPFEAYKVNTSVDFYFHVFNQSNGVPVISGIVCYFHLYDRNKNHLFNDRDSTSDNFDYEFSIDGNNLTEFGYYAYVIQCNDSDHGAFVAHEFYVTNDGEPINEEKSILTLAIVLGLTIALMLAAFLFAYIYANTDKLNRFLKILFLGASLLCGISAIAVQTIVSEKYEAFLRVTTAGMAMAGYNLVLWVFRITIATVLVWLIYTAAMNALGKKVGGPEQDG